MKSIVASYNLPNTVKSFIDTQSQSLSMGKGKFLAYLIEDYQRSKQETKNLKMYFEMATDKDFLIDQISESELDLQVENAVNPSFTA